MNILIFSWRGIGHPNFGGAEIVTHEHAKSWVMAGHQVVIFTSSFKGAKEKEIIDGVVYLRFGNQILGVHLNAFIWYLFKNNQRYDFVVDQFHGIPFFTPLYSRKPKLAVIQETAGKVWFFNSLIWPLNWIVAVVGYLFEPIIFLIYHNTKFMTASLSTKEDLKKFGIPERNITIISHGVIIKTPKLKVKEKKLTFTYLGVLSKDKGIENALKTFWILNKNGNFNFWVVGRVESINYLNKIKRLIKNLSLSEKVRLWGFVSDEKKFEILARSHILVNTSVREGWGLVVIEAAAMGTPTVAFNVTGLKDSIVNGKTGILCQGKVEELAREAINLVNDKKRYQIFVKNCIEWSKNFTWEKSTKQSLELIERLNKGSQ